MAKRFYDLQLWDRDFRKLSPRVKLLWFYLWSKADAAGVLVYDPELIEFETGEKYLMADVKSFGTDKVLVFDGNKILLRQFIETTISKINQQNNAHKPAYRAFLSHKLYRFLDPKETLAGVWADPEKEKENKKEEKGVRGKNSRPQKPTTNHSLNNKRLTEGEELILQMHRQASDADP